jgi:uncharacterized protein (TIGR00369 family)
MRNMTNQISAADSVLEQWLADEDARRAVMNNGVGPGVVTPAQMAGKNGLEAMQATLQGLAPYPSIGKTLDFMLMEVDEGRAVFQGTPGPAHLNPMGGIHGGWYAAILDSALGCAVHSKMVTGRGYTTAELSVNLVKAIGKTSRVRAIGTVLHCGRQLATAEAKLVGPDGTLYAHATTTCLVFEIPSQLKV